MSKQLPKPGERWLLVDWEDEAETVVCVIDEVGQHRPSIGSHYIHLHREDTPETRETANWGSDEKYFIAPLPLGVQS